MLHPPPLSNAPCFDRHFAGSITMNQPDLDEQIAAPPREGRRITSAIMPGQQQGILDGVTCS
jgi:hypothetical protein